MRSGLRASASGSLLKPDLQAQRLNTHPEPGVPTDFGYGLSAFAVAGWMGHNGGVPVPCYRDHRCDHPGHAYRLWSPRLGSVAWKVQ